MAVEECRWVCSTLVQPFPPLHPRGIKDRVEYNSRHVSQLWVRRGPLFGFPGTCPVRICAPSIVNHGNTYAPCHLMAPPWRRFGNRMVAAWRYHKGQACFPIVIVFFSMLQGTRIKECQESSHVGDKNCFIGREAN